MKNCKMSGKNQGKSGNFEVNDKWQPCYFGLSVSHFMGLLTILTRLSDIFELALDN